MVRLPDGREVEFDVPADAKVGDIIEIEVSRKKIEPKRMLTDDILKEFYELSIKEMELPVTREALKKDERPGPQLIEIQQKQFDKLLIDRKEGCQAAGNPKTPELQRLKDKFTYTAQRVFLRALDDRKPKIFYNRKMKRQEILDFFDACNSKMALPETQRVLTDHARKHKEMPNQLIINMQKDLLEVLGFEREFGCACLSSMANDFPNDSELQAAMRLWAITASETCKKAMADADPALAPDSDEMKSMAQIQAQAQTKLSAMSPQERNDLLQRMQAKVSVFQKFNSSDRMRYISKLPTDDKIEFVMAQILLMQQIHAMQNNLPNFTQ
mmetsp:Transcript_12749/g.15433  ORF Transcript_12749/g.15433 Transcript_12749/m.15433 type:complete len:327 (-) Transcript_12749:1792-2772(-)